MVGYKELLIILLVVLIIFGGKRLPELGRGLGRGLSNFRKAMSGQEEKTEEKETKATTPPESGEPKV
ncbi:MAG: twin-arginine translocase TatA/TatE family subunit [Deltaproteobacteria bacterium]|jgi:sec-independent protein translocase protein TatA|nr:twin-arginine translocase TatA/TatE family subunit [Deltaproteobacteria bacterium]